ncbi:hypothetical protein [Streptomyces sp. UNOC14_S4]|uniref:hypothetical protein n=1 Tax=Streptomyces sp. UNOC14_S4 TaxID=2872340 RepID=UPI001E3F2E4A|nr:hypothetical protein [Streptomyces sp. UNOC14_S4]MCC3772336.1 hypothetical protein [Streptomyces sp. UNOC14_S4]
MRAGQPDQGPRALRATVFAVVCVLLAALGHAVMSGTTVPWWAVGVAFAGTASGAWFLAGRERGPLLITLATVGAQTGLHSFFSLAQDVVANAARAAAAARAAGMPGGASMDMSGMPGMGMSGHSMGGHPMGGHSMPMGHAMSGMAGDMGGMGGMGGMHAGHGALGMWSAHVLVAAVCGIWLSGGEHAAFRLARTLRTRLFAPLLVLFHDVPTCSGPPRIRADRTRADQRLRQLLYAHVLATRGPPARVAVAFG